MHNFFPFIVISNALFGLALPAALSLNAFKQPNETTVWRAGGKYLIEWDSQFRLPKNQYYSNFTRVTLELHRPNLSKAPLQIVKDYPFSYGSVYWSIPSNTTSDKQPTLDVYVTMYPSYFDWPAPHGCRSCKKYSLISENFKLTQNCSSLACTPDVVESFWIPPQNTNSSYWDSIKAIGLGVGITAIVGFFIVGLVYTKKTRKTWNSYRQRRSGVVYKQNPFLTPEAPINPHRSDGSRPSFATSDQLDEQWSEIAEDDMSYRSFDDQSRSDVLFPQHTRLGMLTLPQSPPKVLDKLLINDPVIVNVPPPLPPMQTIRKISSEPAVASGFSDGANNTIQNPSALSAPSAHASASPIPRSEAIMVGNLFRNVLRVSASTPALASKSHEATSKSSQNSTDVTSTRTTTTQSPRTVNTTNDHWHNASPNTIAYLSALGEQAQTRRGGPLLDQCAVSSLSEVSAESRTSSFKDSEYSSSPVLSSLNWSKHGGE